MSIEGINNNGGEKKEVSLSYEQERNIKTLLGTDEQIYGKVKASLDALERNQAGSYEIGTSMFYKTIIGLNVNLNIPEFNLCKSVIDRFVGIVKNDKVQERDKKDLLGEVDDYHDGLNKEELAKRNEDLKNREEDLYGGREYIDK